MSSKSSTKTTNTPYDPAAIKASTGALSDAYGQAKGTISQYSPALQGAINQIQQNVTTPPAFVTDARNQLDKTINGDYLDPSTNPYSAGMAKLIADKTAGEYGATFGASGRSHGGMAALLSSQGVGDALNSFYGGIYNQERGNQQQATLAEPSFNQDLLTQPNGLFAAVNNLTALPQTAAGTYAAGTGSLLSPYTTQQTTQRQSLLPQIIGAAASIGGAALGVPGLGAGLMSAGAAPAAAGGLSSFIQQNPFGNLSNYYSQNPFGVGLQTPGFGG